MWYLLMKKEGIKRRGFIKVREGVKGFIKVREGVKGFIKVREGS